MEQTPKTSFIPKQTIGGAQGRTRGRRSFNVLTFVAMVVFLAVLALAVGAFFYKQYSVTRLNEQKKALEDLHASFNADGDIESIRALEHRFNVAKSLLDQHISVSRVFDALEARVQDKAQITSFDYGREESGNAHIELTGLAQTFNTAALQERGLNLEQTLKTDSIVFSDLNLNESGDVTFAVSADLDGKAVAYVPFADDLEEGVGSTTAEVATSTADSLDDLMTEATSSESISQ